VSEIAATLARVDGKVYAALDYEERQRYDDYVQALFEHEDAIHEGCRSEVEVHALERQIHDLEGDLDDERSAGISARLKGFDEAIARVIAGAQRLKEAGPKEDQTT
jgi:hypothetical protein